MNAPIVHRVQGNSFPVNAYLIETGNGLILVDSTLTVSDGRAVAARAKEIGKPLLGAIVTHAHPDHYGAAVEILMDSTAELVAVDGVNEAIRRDDPEKERILRPMFGDEWPLRRRFPDRTVSDGEPVTFDGVTLTPVDIGPSESPHDSLWVLEGDEERVFVGDLFYNRMHAYLADGYYERWLENLERARSRFGPGATLYPGHGAPATPAMLAWQEAYIRTFLDAVGSARARGDAVQAVTDRMKTFLKTDDLLFLMQLSVPAFQAAQESSA